MQALNPKRILLVDDNSAIHEDFRKVLDPTIGTDDAIDALKADLFGAPVEKPTNQPGFTLDSAYQGEAALELVKQSVQSNTPYALAFVDIRMPPGWDGITTITKLWQVDPDIQIVICSAHSDYSWEEISQKLKSSDNFLILKKPFDVVEIRQMAAALTRKWLLNKQVQFQIENLQTLVSERTAEIEQLLSLSKATLESTQEGILVIDTQGNVSAHNQIFLDLWHLNGAVLKNKTASDIVQHLANQLFDPDLFQALMSNLCEHPKTENTREWKTKEGRVFELFAHPQLLKGNITGCVFSFRDISRRKELEEQLLHQATHDSLTQLPNRVLMMDRIQQSIVHAKHSSQQIGVMLLDLDNFKQINDTLGHNLGDTFLKNIANKLKSCLRDCDTVARLGGDEFVVVLAPSSSEDFVRNCAKNILKMIFETTKVDGHDIVTSCSVGIALYPKDGTEPETLLKNADAALYCAKEMGKNSYQFFVNEFNRKILHRAELTSALRNALERNELVLNYQPLIELKSGRVIGLEALIRWNHPTLGQVQPNDFIPLAEETGLIMPIGEWVLRTACQQAKHWQQHGFPGLQMAVNVSVHELKQADYLEKVQAVLTETALDPRCLELEITESTMMGNIDDITEKMNQLKALGVRLTMDDFGTGYSCLSQMKNFPFEKLKIDKNFIDNVASDQNDSCIVEAIINMTQKMGINVLAEGIEREEQVEFLRKHHNNQVQGYYFSPPLNEQDCAQFLEKSSQKAIETVRE